MAFILFIISFLIYSLTASNSIFWDDYAKIMLSSNSLWGEPFGISPILMLCGKIFTLLPFGTISFRLNLFSCLFGSLSVVVFFCFLVKFMKLWSAYDKNFIPFMSDLALRKLNLFIIFTAFLSSLVFALSRIMWTSTFRFQSYSVSLFFIILFFYIFFKAYERIEENKWPYIFALSAGLGLAHDISLFPYIIIFCAPLIWIKKKLVSKYPTFLINMLFLFLLGFTLLLSCVIRSRVYETEIGLYDSFFGQNKNGLSFFIFFSFPFNLIPFRIISIIQIILREIPLIFLFLAFLGFPAAMQPKRRFWLPFLLIVVINIMLLFRNEEWKPQYFLPTFFTLFSLSALGSFTFFLIFFSRSLEFNVSKSGKVRSSSLPQIILLFMIFAAVILQAIKNYGLFYEKNDYVSENVVRKLLKEIPPKKHIYIDSREILGPLLYMQKEEKFRNDIQIASRFDYDNFVASKDDLKGSAKIDLVDSSAVLKYKLPLSLLNPYFLFFNFTSKNPNKENKKIGREHYVYLSALFNEIISDNPDLSKEDENYKYFMKVKNDYLLILFYSGVKNEPINEWKESVFKIPDYSDPLINLITAYIDLKEFDKAKSMMEETAISAFPDDSDIRYLRGIIFQNESDFIKAEREYFVSVKLNPNNQNALLKLSEIYIKKNENQKALNLVNRILNINPRNSDAIKLKHQLSGF